MPSRTSPLCFLTFAFALSACATAPEPIAAVDAGEPGVRVVLAPMNLVVRAPAEVAGKEDRVWQVLLDYFESRDGTVAVLAPGSAERLWLEASRDLGVSERERALLVARSRFARALAEHHDFDVLVLPSVVLRPGWMHGDHASWDGVQRRVPNSESMTPPVLADVMGPGFFVQSQGLRGKVAGASLHVFVLRSDGSAAFEGIGGLDLVQEVQLDDGRDGDWTFATREELFAEPANLREGVARAFEHQLLATAEGR